MPGDGQLPAMLRPLHGLTRVRVWGTHDQMVVVPHQNVSMHLYAKVIGHVAQQFEEAKTVALIYEKSCGAQCRVTSNDTTLPRHLYEVAMT